MENKDTETVAVSKNSEKEIKEVILDNKHFNELLQLSNYQSLESISLRKTGMITLENFPHCPKLKKLELSDNHIKDGLHHLTKLSNLVYLNLSRNKISRIEDLQPLVSLENLQILNLMGCAITKMPDYRASVFSLIPSLKSLDKLDIFGHSFKNSDNDKEGNEVLEDQKMNLKREINEENEIKMKVGPPPLSGKLFKFNESLDDSFDISAPAHLILSYNGNTQLQNGNASQNGMKKSNSGSIRERTEIKQQVTIEQTSKIPGSPVRFDEKEEEKKRKRSLQSLFSENYSEESDEEDDEYDPTDDEEEEEEEEMSEEEDSEEGSSSEEMENNDKKKRKESPTANSLPNKKRK